MSRFFSDFKFYTCWIKFWITKVIVWSLVDRSCLQSIHPVPCLVPDIVKRDSLWSKAISTLLALLSIRCATNGKWVKCVTPRWWYTSRKLRIHYLHKQHSIVRPSILYNSVLARTPLKYTILTKIFISSITPSIKAPTIMVCEQDILSSFTNNWILLSKLYKMQQNHYCYSSRQFKMAVLSMYR